MRGPTTSLNENAWPGRMTVPSMKSAIRWTLWMRFDDDAPICVVKETSFVVIPSACACHVVSDGSAGPITISALRAASEDAAAVTAATVAFGSTSKPLRERTTET